MFYQGKYKGKYKEKLKEDFIPLIIVINAILLMKPYFVWETYSHFMDYMSNIVICMGIAIQILFFKRKTIARKSFCLIILLIMYYLYMFINHYQMNLILYIKIGLIFFQIGLLVCLSAEKRKKAYRLFVIFFACSLVLPIIIWSLIELKIELPYYELQSEATGKYMEGYYYKQYYGAVFLDNYIRPNSLYRLCGIFDEPGVVGTTAGMILAAENGNLRKKSNLIIMIGGILAFSLAFVGLLSSFYFIKILKNSFKRIQRKKQMILTMLILLLGLSAMPYVAKLDYVRSYVINKIQRSILSKDPRNTIGFQENYKEFLKSGSFHRYLFGHGYAATALTPSMSGSNSYKIQIYDLGIIGFFSLYWIIFYAAIKEKNKKEFAVKVFFIVFCISTYQRISVFTLSNFILLVGGTDYLELKKGEKISGNNDWSSDI